MWLSKPMIWERAVPAVAACLIPAVLARVASVEVERVYATHLKDTEITVQLLTSERRALDDREAKLKASEAAAAKLMAEAKKSIAEHEARVRAIDAALAPLARR